MALPIIIDCDPGHDDAIALVLALASPELEVKAITSSAGNQTPEKTLRNVLRMLTLLKRPDIPVAGGAVKPLMRELIIADNVHGESGLDGPALPEPSFAPQSGTAVELMAKTLRESSQPVTIVSTGPQTNVALLLNSHPELHAKIARIVIMGGAMGLGNWTPAAEFNIYVDPEAAEIVFQSGIPVVMAGLNVTHKAQIHRRYRTLSRHWQPDFHHRRRTAGLLYGVPQRRKMGICRRAAARPVHHRLAAETRDFHHR